MWTDRRTGGRTDGHREEDIRLSQFRVSA